MHNNSIIPPEVKNDELYAKIIETIEMFSHEISTAVEVGASSGEGSTEAITYGLNKIVGPKKFFTIEASPNRFALLKDRYKHLEWVVPFLGSSVEMNEYLPIDFVKHYHETYNTAFCKYGLDFLVEWYKNEKSLIENNPESKTGIIQLIKSDLKIDSFDFVMLDGSPYTGYAEFSKIYGSKIIVFDDVYDIKHDKSHAFLRQTAAYECLFCNLKYRNGYSIWVKKEMLLNVL